MPNDQSLQYIRISDFTPGIVRFARGGIANTYSTGAPPGSAAHAYRCIAQQNVGLIPFPAYNPASTYTKPATANTQCLTLGNIRSLGDFVAGSGPGGQLDADNLVCGWVTFNSASTANTLYEITRGAVGKPVTQQTSPVPPTVPTVVYTETGTIESIPWNTMDMGVWLDPATSLVRRTVLTSSPISFIWITVPGWRAPASPPAQPYATGPLPAPSAFTIRLFFHENRMCFFRSNGAALDTLGFGGAGVDLLSVSDPSNTLTGFAQAGAFYGELGATFSVWGSISSGELFLIYENGGGVALNGDLLNVNLSAIKLPGVVGSELFGPAAQSPAGLLYATQTDGVYVWNGDNVSQKISMQIPDDTFFRLPLPAQFDVNGPRHFSCQIPWGNQVMFPNNWVYNIPTSSWWLCEDPTVRSFQVHGASNWPRVFYSAPNWNLASPSVAPSLTIYQFDREQPASTYHWLSNPLSVTQTMLVSIQMIELVASNATSTPCTVTITPTVPPGQIPLQQQTQTQPLVFTIPANTVGWRGYQRLGYTDFNVQLSVDAANATPPNAAPTIHEINVGYTTTRPSGIQ